MKITAKAWVLVGVMATTFIIFVRWLAGKLKLSGLQTAMANA